MLCDSFYDCSGICHVTLLAFFLSVLVFLAVHYSADAVSLLSRSTISFPEHLPDSHSP